MFCFVLGHEQVRLICNLFLDDFILTYLFSSIDLPFQLMSVVSCCSEAVDRHASRTTRCMDGFGCRQGQSWMGTAMRGRGGLGRGHGWELER